jgi:hypothetical protein
VTVPLARLLAPLILAAALVVGVATAHADGVVKLSLRPGGESGAYFSLAMAPGERRALKVQLGNGGTEAVRVRTFAADAFTLVNGGFGARLDGEPTTGTTAWLAYPTETLDLEAGEALDRTFVVVVPADAKPGEYQASLVLQNADPLGGPGAAAGVAVAFKQVVRHALAVSITVAGPLAPGLQIGAASQKPTGDGTILTVGVNNTGNVRLKPTGELVLRDAAGRELGRHPVAMDTVYAGTETTAEMPFARPLDPGEYTVTASLADASGASAMSGPLALSVPRPAAGVDAAAPAAPGRATLVQAPPTSAASPVVGISVAWADPSPVMLVVGVTSMGMGMGFVLSGLGLMLQQRRAGITVVATPPPRRPRNAPVEVHWF